MRKFPHASGYYASINYQCTNPFPASDFWHPASMLRAAPASSFRFPCAIRHTPSASNSRESAAARQFHVLRSALHLGSPSEPVVNRGMNRSYQAPFVELFPSSLCGVANLISCYLSFQSEAEAKLETRGQKLEIEVRMLVRQDSLANTN